MPGGNLIVHPAAPFHRKAPMAIQPYLLFDAGGTIVFNDPHLLSGLANDAGYPIQPDAILREGARGIHRFDCHVRQTRRWMDIGLETYLNGIYMALGIPAQVAATLTGQAEALNLERSLWTWTEPWVAGALSALRADGWRMSVISNADGRVERQLTELGLCDGFDEVFDSACLGIAKPDSRIFMHACDTLGLKPADCLYIGDTFFVDVWGANRAGMGAVHLDPYGYYRDWPGWRIADIRVLAGFLASHRADGGEHSMPMRDFTIQNTLG